MITITINITISINILHIHIYIIYICNYVCMCCGLLWFFGEWPATRVPNMWAPCRTFGTPSEPCGQMICGWCFRWIGWIDGWDLIDSHYMRLIHTQPLYGFSSLVFWFSIYEICFFSWLSFLELVNQSHAGCVLQHYYYWLVLPLNPHWYGLSIAQLVNERLARTNFKTPIGSNG